MMRLLKLLAALLLVTGTAFCQTNWPPPMILAAAPAGGCPNGILAMDIVAENMYFCAGGTWHLANGGGSTPRLDQILDPTGPKTFAMGGHFLTLGTTASDTTLIVNGAFYVQDGNTYLGIGFLDAAGNGAASFQNLATSNPTKPAWLIYKQNNTNAFAINNDYPGVDLGDFIGLTDLIGIFGHTRIKSNVAFVGGVYFTGAGLDDATSGGTYSALDDLAYCVQIDANGTPDTFEWGTAGSCSDGATGVAITGGADALSSGVTVTFAATTGHTIGDNWTFTAYAPIPLTLQDSSGNITAKVRQTGITLLGPIAVGSLPAADSTNAGYMVSVTDSTAVAAEGQTCVAGGASVVALAFSNGTVWKCF